jgi:3'-phosphoadenosine 5'-phosphosulfate sulfotransferase (PAPS reductase)/FAD synthetase
MDPYKVEPPFYVSFSGGRTSGYLLRHVLDAWGGQMPKDALVLFANTGKEHEATLEFVRAIEQHWCPVTWLEWQDAQPTQTFRVVTFESASRKGEPFEALIHRRKMLPNPVARFCTGELKVNTMHRYLRSMQYKVSDVTAVLGIRADEPRRVAKIRGKASEDDRDIVMPLVNARVDRQKIDEWWSRQPFDLRLPHNDNAFGNCDLCFLKSRDRLERVIADDPDRATWWAQQEAALNHLFRKDRTYREVLHSVTIQGRLFQPSQRCDDEDALPCDCTD